MLITGGCRSGKSGYALACGRAKSPRIFIATATACDDEMAGRIKMHRTERGERWKTVEEPLALAEALNENSAHNGIVVVDCITLWTNNMIHGGKTDGAITRRVSELGKAVLQAESSVIIVTNEIGAGIVPENPLARRFRDLLGLANQRLASVCGRVVCMIAGIPLPIKEEKDDES